MHQERALVQWVWHNVVLPCTRSRMRATSEAAQSSPSSLPTSFAAVFRFLLLLTRLPRLRLLLRGRIFFLPDTLWSGRRLLCRLTPPLSRRCRSEIYWLSVFE